MTPQHARRRFRPGRRWTSARPSARRAIPTAAAARCNADCAAHKLRRGRKIYPAQAAEKTAAAAARRGLLPAPADGAVLTRTRPPRGLLGGMVEFFGCDWRATGRGLGRAPCAQSWRRSPDVAWRMAGEIDHVFTHFALKLTVFVGAAPRAPSRRRVPLARRDANAHRRPAERHAKGGGARARLPARADLSDARIGS